MYTYLYVCISDLWEWFARFMSRALPLLLPDRQLAIRSAGGMSEKLGVQIVIQCTILIFNGTGYASFSVKNWKWS